MKKWLTLCLVLLLLTGVGIGIWFIFGSKKSDLHKKTVQEKPPLVKLVVEKGNVQVKTIKGQWQAGKNGELLEAGQSVKTDAGSAASLMIHETAVIRLDEKTEVSLDTIATDKTSLKQTLGNTFSRVEKLSGKNKTYEVETPTTVATVRGTEFGVFVDSQKKTRVIAKENQVAVIPLKEKGGMMVRLNEILLSEGQGTEVEEADIAAETDEIIELKLESWEDLMETSEERWLEESDKIEEKIELRLEAEMEKLQTQFESIPELEIEALPEEPIPQELYQEIFDPDFLKNQLPPEILDQIPSYEEYKDIIPDIPADIPFKIPQDYNYDIPPDVPLLPDQIPNPQP